MVKKRVSWEVYIIAAVITLVIFSLGVALGFFISNEKYSIIKNDLEDLKLQQKDAELELLLINSLETKSCYSIKYEIDKMAVLSSKLGDRVSVYDTEMIKNADFYNLKQQYILTLIEFWNYWELFKKNCNSSVNTVLYFYSIKNCDDCQAQGFVLSYLKEKYPDKIMTFALDKDEDLYSLNLIKNTYNVTTAPTLIINNKKYEGLKDINALNDLLIL
jgi:glutaredoxin